jgi:hypothetical protein
MKETETTSSGPVAEAPLEARLAAGSLMVRPWTDHVLDELGHDPRSAYVEQFWLGILGPTTTWLLRRFAAGFDASPEGFRLDLRDTARQLGLSLRASRPGRTSPFIRALTRCCQFDLAQLQDDDVLAVRRTVPPLNRRQVLHLPETLQEEHRRWQRALVETPLVEQLRRRARRLALTLFELGEDEESTERQLLRWRFHPALCHEATAWAAEQHRRRSRRPPAPA